METKDLQIIRLKKIIKASYLVHYKRIQEMDKTIVVNTTFNPSKPPI